MGDPGPQADGVDARVRRSRARAPPRRRPAPRARPGPRPTSVDELGRGRRGGGRQPDRPGVRGRGGERAQADHQAHAERGARLDHRVDELPPVEVRLGADQEEHVGPGRSWPARTWMRGHVSSVVDRRRRCGPRVAGRAGPRSGRRRRWRPARSGRRPESEAIAAAAPSPASTQPSRADHQDGPVQAGVSVDLVEGHVRSARRSLARPGCRRAMLAPVARRCGRIRRRCRGRRRRPRRRSGRRRPGGCRPASSSRRRRRSRGARDVAARRRRRSAR